MTTKRAPRVVFPRTALDHFLAIGALAESVQHSRKAPELRAVMRMILRHCHAYVDRIAAPPRRRASR